MKIKVTLQTNVWAFCLIALGHEPSETTVSKIVEQIFSYHAVGPKLQLEMALNECVQFSKERNEIKAISDIADGCFYQFVVDSKKHPVAFIATMTGRIPDDEFVLKMMEAQKEQ